MSKVYEITGQVMPWLEDHREQICIDILEGAERAQRKGEEDVQVFSLRTTHGITHCCLQDAAAIAASLLKVEGAFVQQENYECAARARDCGVYWKSQAGIYKENPQI